MRTPRPPASLPVALVLAVVAIVLLAPHHTDLPIAWLSSPHLLGAAAAGGTPLWWALEDLANVVLFVPVGLLAARRLGPVPGLALAAAISAGAESAQQFIPERHASLLDVSMNVLGSALGVGLAFALRQRRLPTVAAGPVEPAVRGLGDVHALQAGRAVRRGDPALVEGSVGIGQREVLAVPRAADHSAIVLLPADTRVAAAGAVR